MTCEVKPETGKFIPTVFYHLFTDLDLALSLVKTARVMPSGKIKQSYESHAVRTYREVEAKASKMHMPADTREALNQKLQLVARRLSPVLAPSDRRTLVS